VTSSGLTTTWAHAGADTVIIVQVLKATAPTSNIRFIYFS
jgi:hypothetical protein